MCEGDTHFARLRIKCKRTVNRPSSSRAPLESGQAEPLAQVDPLAQAVTRGVCRLLDRLGHVGLTEFVLRGGRRADIIALGPAGELTIVEVKSSLADFRADAKWPEYLEFCERYYFAVPRGFPLEVLPADQGLIVADGYDAAILREPERRPLTAARRKAVTLRFGQVAGRRLRLLLDPAGLDPTLAG